MLRMVKRTQKDFVCVLNAWSALEIAAERLLRQALIDDIDAVSALRLFLGLSLPDRLPNVFLRFSNGDAGGRSPAPAGKPAR